MTEIIAHRGLRSKYPENTLSAIKSALKINKLKFIEFDVELAKDGTVVLHQETLVTDAKFTKLVLADRNFTSRDWVIEKAVAEIQLLDAGSWFDGKFANEKVPTLKEVLSLDWQDKIPCIELKDATYWGVKDLNRPKMIVDAVYDDLKNFSSTANIISFNPEIIKLTKQAFPHFSTALALWTEWEGKVANAIEQAKIANADGITIPDVMLLKDLSWLEQVKSQNLLINVYPISPARNEPEHHHWTAKSQKDKWLKLKELGVDGITSDFADETIELLLS